MRFLPVNLNALLVELDDLPQTLALLGALQADPVPGVQELLPAARTVLVTYDSHTVSRAALTARIAACDIHTHTERPGELVEIPVRYSGEDLAEVAQMLGLSPDEVIQRHTASLYTAAFVGFAPGFAYLSGGDAVFDVPRRKTPRTHVPAGAVALASTFCGVYPKVSPGGWQIIGQTDVPMWDLAREVPALVQPGSRVRFVEQGASPALPRPQAAAAVHPEPKGPTKIPAQGPALVVRQTGLLALFQDLGRPGQAGQGVSASGAMDRAALRAANRLVGNPPGAACIELAYGGFEVESRGDTVVALTGADVPLTLISAAGPRWPLSSHAPLALADGDRLQVGPPRAGMRSYLALRGGFAVEPVLGSCGTDVLAGIGPAPLAVGDVLGVGALAQGVVGAAGSPVADLPAAGDTVTLDVVLGPRTDWLVPQAVELLRAQAWQVTPQSNRVGLRLQGNTPLAHATPRELPSEGTSCGAIQVPPSGQPVLFLADHPMTGGYPVIGAVAPYHLDLAGQIPVGAFVRFHPVSVFDPVETAS
ncbi:5-oxoprolinase/urea amidolyase family protein [Amphibiibacter pelophylacis]|uniref:5-oxoprolinase/urea amidolyase family protein n=1 Tax=Amphibiibacter pelophylacis TaxID=1799477 RepID=A0ACC6P2V3_9BURK